MKKIKRRAFLCDTFLAAAALYLPLPLAGKTLTKSPEPFSSALPGPDIIDTNIHLMDYPFRTLKYGKTKDLVSKLRRHRIIEGWAGSFEALFHKDIQGVNARLAEECRVNGDQMLLPFGTVNLAWPDWEEDLRRCHEVHRMPGIRLYPIYQTFDLTHPDFPRFVELATARDMIIQIVGDITDSRHHHPIVQVRDLNLEPLVEVMKQFPQAKIQVLNWNHRIRQNLLQKLISETTVGLDISHIEGTGAVGRLIQGNSWSGKGHPVPVTRFLFGSYAPYFPVEANLIKLFESPLNLKEMTSIMQSNAQNFKKN